MQTDTTAAPQPKPYQCRHLFIDGHQCGSPALRQELFCYYHHATRRPPRRLRNHAGFAAYEFSMPEDRRSLQHALNEVLRLLAFNDIEPERARQLLYGLSLASHNLHSLARFPDAVPATPAVDDMVFHPNLGGLAPEPAEPATSRHPSPKVEDLQFAVAPACHPEQSEGSPLPPPCPHPSTRPAPYPILTTAAPTPEDRLRRAEENSTPPPTLTTKSNYFQPEFHEGVWPHRRPGAEPHPGFEDPQPTPLTPAPPTPDPGCPTLTTAPSPLGWDPHESWLFDPSQSPPLASSLADQLASCP